MRLPIGVLSANDFLSRTSINGERTFLITSLALKFLNQGLPGDSPFVKSLFVQERSIHPD